MKAYGCLIFMLLTISTVVFAQEKSNAKWCEVAGNYVVVEDRLFNYIKSFTNDAGRRHFLFAIAMVESGMNPYSPGGSCGEIGMMQVLPATGRFVSRLNGKQLDLNKVEGNIFSSLHYIDFIIAQMDKHCPKSMELDFRIQMAAAAYNGGAGHLSKGCTLNCYNKSARRYSKRFLKWWRKKYTSKTNYEKNIKRLRN